MPSMNEKAQYTMECSRSLLGKVPMQKDTTVATKRLVSVCPEDAGEEVIN